MKLRYITDLKLLPRNSKIELQNLMDESGMFYGRQLEEFVDPREYKSAVCIIDSNENVCAFAFMEDMESTFELSYLYVDPRMRKMGIGGKLVEKVVAEARRKGAKKVELSVGKDNQQAMSLYKKQGFQVTGSNDDKYVMSAPTKPLEK